MSIDTKALRELYAHVQASDNAGLQLQLLATAARNLPALLDAYDHLAALEAELASLRTDRDGAAEACRMLQEDKARLEQQLAAAQAEARELKQRIDIMLCQACHDRCNTPPTGLFHSPDPEEEPCIICWLEQQSDETVKHAERADKAEAEARELRAELARVRELPAKWRAAPQNPDEPLLAMAADELDAALSRAAERESLPLMARDTCTNCGGTGVGGYHVHAPQEDAVEELRCEACDGFGFIEHGPKDCPATAPELPLMARREWMRRDTDYFVVHGDFCLEIKAFGRAPHFDESGELVVCAETGDSIERDQVDAEAQPDGIYRIADTDEHGLPVIERTADMPEDVTHMTLHTRRFFRAGELRARSVEGDEGLVRIEDYRPAAQEIGDA